jgi:hypothetical protein
VDDESIAGESREGKEGEETDWLGEGPVLDWAEAKAAGHVKTGEPADGKRLPRGGLLEPGQRAALGPCR